MTSSTKDSCEWLLNYAITKLVYYDLSAYKHYVRSCAVAALRPTFRSPRSSQPQSPGVCSHLPANRILYTNAPEKSNMRGRFDPLDVMLSCGDGVIQCEASTVSFTRARTRTRSIFVYSSIDVQMSALVTPAERYKKGLFGSSDRCGQASSSAIVDENHH